MHPALWILSLACTWCLGLWVGYQIERSRVRRWVADVRRRHQSARTREVR
jgi:hypothetical protein